MESTETAIHPIITILNRAQKLGFDEEQVFRILSVQDETRKSNLITRIEKPTPKMIKTACAVFDINENELVKKRLSNRVDIRRDILTILRSRKEDGASIFQIRSALANINVHVESKTIRSNISRLLRKNEIKRVFQGTYAINDRIS